MSEVTFDTEDNPWRYVGRTKDGKPKFRKYTNQTIEYVKEYLDGMGVAYLVDTRGFLIFIYREKEPMSRYSPRYSYYYTTGRWGSDKRNKHYHSDGIEHFMEKYYTPIGVEQDEH